MWRLSPGLRRTLRGEYKVSTKIELLDTNYNPVSGITLFSADRTSELTNFVTDGLVDVDTTRATRRTAELTLLNPTAEFTPATEDFDPNGPWVGLIYLNRLVRIWRGAYVSGTPEYVPVGTFMIDKTNVIAERNMSLVNLTMSDLWKKMAKSYADRAYNFAKGSWYNDIIRTILNDAGGYTPKLLPIIDPLNGRLDADKKTNDIVTLDEGQSRGDFLKELSTTWDIDMYYDPMGQFRTEDRKTAADKRSVWTFSTADDPDRDSYLISANREFSDDNLYNHVIVIGLQADGKTPIRIERVDADPRSKTNVALIGDRVWLLQDDKLNNSTKAYAALNRAWATRFQLGETIQAETISNPALEGDDVVTIRAKRLVKVDYRYRLTRFTVPLVSSRQDIQVTNIIFEKNL